jgi:hypothetical protein
VNCDQAMLSIYVLGGLVVILAVSGILLRLEIGHLLRACRAGERVKRGQ